MHPALITGHPHERTREIVVRPDGVELRPSPSNVVEECILPSLGGLAVLGAKPRVARINEQLLARLGDRCPFHHTSCSR